MFVTTTTIVSAVLIILTVTNFVSVITMGFGIRPAHGDSMEPTFEDRLTLLPQVPANTIEVGDIVAFVYEDNTFTNTVRVHRVIDIDPTRDNPYLIKGDNRVTVDGWYSENDIVSEVPERNGEPVSLQLPFKFCNIL